MDNKVVFNKTCFLTSGWKDNWVEAYEDVCKQLKEFEGQMVFIRSGPQTEVERDYEQMKDKHLCSMRIMVVDREV